jgi:hypothetical protein
MGVVLLLAAWAAGCSKDYPNPFDNPNPTATPGPDAVLLVTSDAWSASPGAPRELFAVSADGSQMTRLTFCNTAERVCDNSEVAIGRDPARVVLRRIPADSDLDGRLTPADGETVVYVDLERGVEASLLSSSGSGVSGLDWSPVDELLVFSGQTIGQPDDLFRMDVNGQNNRQLTLTPTVAERRPRIDPTGSVAVFERIAEGAGEVWIFGSATSLLRVTQGGTPGEALPGTGYRVGSDADPDYSPDGRLVVFRRMTALGQGRGFWDLLNVSVEGIGLGAIAQGPRYRGAPDWGPLGIVFEEVDEEGRASLVVFSPEDGSRRTLATVGAGYTLSMPRWLP